MRRFDDQTAPARAGEQQRLKVRVGLAHFDPDKPCSFEELVAQADAGMPGDESAAYLPDR